MSQMKGFYERVINADSDDDAAVIVRKLNPVLPPDRALRIAQYYRLGHTYPDFSRVATEFLYSNLPYLATLRKLEALAKAAHEKAFPSKEQKEQVDEL